MFISLILLSKSFKLKPKASVVLTSYLRQSSLPPWTSYFVKYADVIDDQRGFSHFNWLVEDANYHILRTGCWPYMKYHCTKRSHQDLSLEDKIFRVIKVINFGIPCLAYGIVASFLISHTEHVMTPEGEVKIHFLYKEDQGVISSAPEAFRLLNGIFCVYKPTELSMKLMRDVILTKLAKNLNDLEPRIPAPIVNVKADIRGQMVVFEKEDFVDNPLAVGPRYQVQDFKFAYAHYLPPIASGVTVVGINKGAGRIHGIRKSHLIRTYYIAGKFGFSTDTHFTDGKVIERSKFGHVTQGRMDRTLMTIQGSHQRLALEHLGLDPHSQNAYEILAADGLIRPAENSAPLLYALKCVDLDLPNFGLEISCINENIDFLKLLIQDLGLMLKTNATCTQVRCIRYGKWTIDHALLRKHWSLQHVMDNIAASYPILQDLRSQTVHLQQIDKDYPSAAPT